MNNCLTAKIRQLIDSDPDVLVGDFVNELTTARNDLNKKNAYYQLVIIQRMMFACFTKKEATPTDNSSVTTLLEQGFVFQNKCRDLPAAARAFTHAITHANKFTESAGVAHMSRATVLKSLGHTQAAYDDCTIALEHDYPEHLRAVATHFQATLAFELSDVKSLREHTTELQFLSTSDFLSEIAELKKAAVALENQNNSQLAVDGKPEDKAVNEAVKVSDTLPKYRIMLGKKAFAKNERVFEDRAFVVLPSIGAQICSNCAAFMIVPFNCVSCKGLVVYCSLKCQDEHSCVHIYECKLWECDKEQLENGTMLVLRMLLTGLKQIVPILADKPDASSFWAEIFGKSEHDHIEYVKVLKNRSCWEMSRASHKELKEMTMLSKFLITYLKFTTSFYDLLQGTCAPLGEWMIFTHALLIRHFGQVKIGTHVTLSTMDPKRTLISHPIEVGLLAGSTTIYVTCFYYFPFKNNCTHDCTPKLDFKIQGKSLTAYALDEIPNDDDITVTLAWFDIFRPRTKFRQQVLKNDFYFECRCTKCTVREGDVS